MGSFYQVKAILKFLFRDLKNKAIVYIREVSEDKDPTEIRSQVANVKTALLMSDFQEKFLASRRHSRYMMS